MVEDDVESGLESALTSTNLKSSQDSKQNRLGGRGFFRPNRGYSFVKNGIQGNVFILSENETFMPKSVHFTVSLANYTVLHGR